jgi:glutamate/tyrosine decarboxylase-like PLP-dependent enzyme
VGEGYGADVAAIEAAIGPNTIGIYASAPSYSLGIIDDIPALGRLAAERDLWLHVDACVGGILGYFVRRSGREVPVFDFAAEGVTSISADLHKSGFAAKPASTVHFRTKELRQYAAFAFDDWPHGMYGSLTFTGTRPGGAIAAAWAALNFLGKDGYQELADASMRTKERLIEGLTAVPGVEVFGDPRLYAFAFGVEGIDTRQVTALMNARDWYCPNTVSPQGIHFMATPVHEAAVDAYLADMRECIEEVRAGSEVAAAEARYN